MKTREALACPFCHKELQDAKEAETHLMGNDMGLLCEGPADTSPVVIVRICATRDAYPIFFQPKKQYLN